MSVYRVVLKLKETVYAKRLAQCWHTVNVHQTLVIFVIRCLKSLSISISAIQNIYTAEGIKKKKHLVFLGYLTTTLKILKCFSYLTSKTKHIFVPLGLETHEKNGKYDGYQGE